MKHVDLSNTLAAEMDKVLNSDENKEIFSSSSMLEKLAFKKVSEQDEVSELEAELLKKQASCCECGKDKKHECKCECHKDTEKKASVRNPAREAFNALLKVSEDLETAGFERLAAASVMLAGKLIAEAKAKSSKKSDKKSEKAKSEKGGKKMDMKERMEKMRKMQKGKGKKSDKKDDKKSSKK